MKPIDRCGESFAALACDAMAANEESYDLIVVGGGIYGTFLAYEAAQRGLRPLLIERGQFGQGTSKSSLRIIHGGLRYLQHFDLRRSSESLREQAWFLRNMSEFVTLIGCLMPIYDRGLRRRTIFKTALALNDVLASVQDRGLRRAGELPKSRVLTPEDTIRMFPAVDVEGLRGGAFWCDVMMLDPDKLVSELLMRSRKAGATCLNFVEATRLLKTGNQVLGLEAKEHDSGQQLRFHAPVVVNCAGPQCRELAKKFDRDIPHLFHASIAFNIFIDRPSISDYGLAVTSKRPKASTYFLIPLENRILAGTYHQPWNGPITDPRPKEEIVQSFIRELNLAVPALDLVEDDVLEVHAGFLPAKAEGSREQASRPVIVDHSRAGGPQGFYSVSGVKYTTARAVAEHTLGRIRELKHAGRSALHESKRPIQRPPLGLKN
jgi:glycerol-3-phosphate dehydrogenase